MEHLPTLLNSLSLETNQLLSLCRARGEAMLVKRQLALILETIKKVITEVGSEDHVDEVRSAAVELKNSVFLLLEKSPTSILIGPDGIDYDEVIYQSVLELAASLRYYVSSNTHDPSSRESIASIGILSQTKSNPDLSSRTPITRSESFIDEIELVKKDVEVFVQLCTNLVKYSKEAVIDPKGILSRFFSIMESVRMITSPRGLKTADIKKSSEMFVDFARKVQHKETLEADLIQELSQIVVSLLTSVKKSVQEYMASVANSNSSQSNFETRIEQPQEITRPLGFVHDLTVMDIKRRSYHPDSSPNQLPTTPSEKTSFDSKPFILNTLKTRNRKSCYYKEGELVDNTQLAESEVLQNVASVSGLVNDDEWVRDNLATEEQLEKESQHIFREKHDEHEKDYPSQNNQHQGYPKENIDIEPKERPKAPKTPTKSEPEDNKPHEMKLSKSNELLLEEDFLLAAFLTPFVSETEEMKKHHTILLQNPGAGKLDQLVQKMRKLKSSDDSHKEERYPTIRLKTPAPIVSSKSKFFPKKPDEPSAEEIELALGPFASDQKPVKKGDTLVTYEGEEVVLIMKVIDGKPKVHAATVGVLLERLANEDAQDHDYLRTFLLTFRHILKPIELIELLFQRFNIKLPSNPTPEDIVYFDKWAWRIQYRIVNFLKKWMESCWFDFHKEPKMLANLSTFIFAIQEIPRIKNLAAQIETTQKKLTENSELEERKSAEKKQQIMMPSITSNVGIVDFLSLDPYLIAKHLTLIEFEFFKKVQPQELMIYLWGDPREQKDTDLTENLTNFVNRFNQVSFWVGTEICTVPAIKKRIQIVEKFVHILRILLDLNNYNTIMAIVSGLNHSSVQRLKKTWEGLSSRSLTVLHEIEKTMNPMGNYAPYREIEAKKHATFIPFFGLALKDLIFANDGNPKRLENGLINFGKLRMLSENVNRILLFRNNPYEIPIDQSCYTYCLGLVYIQDEARLYKYSLLCEPRQSNESENTNVRLLNKWQSESEKISFIEKWTGEL